MGFALCGGRLPDVETSGCEACRGPRSIIICWLAMSLLDSEHRELRNSVSVFSSSPEPSTMSRTQGLLADVCRVNVQTWTTLSLTAVTEAAALACGVGTTLSEGDRKDRIPAIQN